jgi:hypothetical protein
MPQSGGCGACRVNAITINRKEGVTRQDKCTSAHIAPLQQEPTNAARETTAAALFEPKTDMHLPMVLMIRLSKMDSPNQSRAWGCRSGEAKQCGHRGSVRAAS